MAKLNIAVIISGIDEEYQSTILSGIHEYAEQNGINIAHFIAFGGVLGNQRNDVGEFNIYNLINYDILDGAILLTNTISSPAVTQKIINQLRKAKIPASSIDFDIEDFYYVGIDNIKAMGEMVKHIVEYHGIHETNYVTGPNTNPESIMRLDAYKSVLESNGIEFNDEDVYHGSFRERDGKAAIEKFIRNGNLQKAVICANDAMAIGAVSTLLENGYRVPEDVMVTGFDNIFNARNYYPAITSVSRPLKQSGYIACSQVHNAINGVNQERRVILDTWLSATSSCGCTSTSCDDSILFKKETYNIIEIYHQDVPSVNYMSCNLAESDDFKENLENMKKFVDMIKCEKFYLCLCDNWLDDVMYDGKNNDYIIEGYTDQMLVPLVYCKGSFGDLEGFLSSSMLPDLQADHKESKFYYFSPIHFNDRCLGYSVVCNSDFPTKSPLYHTWVINICNSIENIRKKTCLESALRKLERLYIIDPLSNIYNRNGFRENVTNRYNRCVERQNTVMLMFADMDGMKYINDNFGHKEGDSAIRNMAQAVKDACKGNEICARFGGDEFIVFADCYTEEQACDIADSIQKNINNYNQKSGKPYTIETSIGWHIEVPEKNTLFDSLITKADQKMYREKKRKPNRRK